MAFLQVSTTNPLGQRPLNFMMKHQGPPVYAGLLGWIGAAATPGDYDTNTQVLGALVSMGAISPDESAQIDAGTLSLDDLPVTMTMINEALSETGQPGAQTVLPLPSNVGAPLSTLPPASSGGVQIVPYTPNVPAAAAAPQIPSGSTITYTVQWTASLLNPLTGTSQAEAALQSALTRYGMSVISSSTNSLPVIGGVTGYSVTFNILDSVGHAHISDAQGVIDSLMRGIVGSNLTGSSITGVYPPGSGGLTPSGAGTGITAWFEQNAGTVAIFVAVIVLGSVALKKL